MHRSSIGLALLLLILPLLAHSASDDTASHHSRQRRHSKISCQHPDGTKGKCVRWNLCPDEKPKGNPVCNSTTGLNLVCCKKFQEPGMPSKCGVRPVPNLQSRSMIEHHHPVAVAEIGETMRAEAIVGGSESWPASWPWAVAIFEQGNFACGGALVSPTCVVTAAHCFDSMTPNAGDFNVRLGDHNLRNVGPGEDPEEQTVARIVMHPEFHVNHSDHDLALLRLNSPVLRTTICLPPKRMSKNNFVGRYSVVAGWGTTKYDPDSNEPFSSVLQEIPVPIKPTAFCEKHYNHVTDYWRAFTKGLEEKRFMCAGYDKGGKDACLGDSGGPLMAELSPGIWSIIGVVCIGYGCGMAEFPGIYTRVTEYQDWIEENCQI